MALLWVLAFDHEGKPVQFDTWLDDLQLYLLSDSKDSVSLFDLASGASTAPPATADSSTRSQWLTRDAAARLAIRNHLPLAEYAHFGLHRTAQALYDAVVARYSSLATATLGRLLLPYLFPELSAFTTVEDLVSHLRASDARYRAAVPAEDHFLSLDPTSLTVDLLEQHLLAAETSAVAVGAAHGTPCPHFFEGCSPSPLAPSYASAAAADVSVSEDVGAAIASAKRRSSKGKGGRGGGGGSDGGGDGSGSGGGGSSGGGGGGATVGGSGGSGGGGGGSGGSGGSRGGGTGSGGTGARRVGFGSGQRQQQQRRSETPSPQQLRKWFLRGASGGIAAAALGASESGTLPGTAPAEALHTFTLDSGASRSFFRDSTTLTPLPAPLPVQLADPSGGPVVARSSTVLQCPAGSACVDLRVHTDSPQQNGIAERRIGLVMEVARTSMIHAAAPHFHWPFVVRYAAHQLNLWPRLSLPETSPTLHWTGKVGDASVFRVWGSRAFVRDTSADKLSPHALPCVFLGFVPDVPGWQFYHPTSRRIFPSQDVTFDESVSFYRLFPYHSAPPPPSPLFLAPGPPPVAVDSGAARGATSGGAEPGGAEFEGAETGGAELGGVETGRAEPGGVATGGGEPEGVEPGGDELEGVEPEGAASESADSGGAEPQGAALSGVSAGASPSLSPQQFREWFVRCTDLRSGASGARGAGPAGAGGTGVAGGAGVTRDTATTGPGGACTRGTGAAGTGGVEGAGAGDLTESGTTGAGGAEVGGPGVGGPRAGGARAVDPGGAVRPRPYFVPLLQQSDRPRAASPTVSRLLATAVTDPSFESAAASALVAELLDFAAACRLDNAIALIAESASASPPSVGGECALGTNVLEDRQEDFESLAAAVPRFASMLLAPEGDPDAPDTPTPCSYEEAITGTYVDEVPPPGANIVDGMWIFRVKRPSGSPPAFKARYVVRGFSQRQGVDYFQTFSPTPKMTTLRVLLHVAAQRDYELHSLDFSTAFQQGSLHEEIWLRRPPGFTESFPTGTQWSLRRLVYGLRQAPHEWHDTLRNTLVALGFAPATADPSLFLCTDTLLPPFYVLVYVDDLVFATADTEALTLVLQRFGFQFSSPQPTPLSTSHLLSAPLSDESVELSGPYPELVGCLMYLMTCIGPDLAYPLSLLAHNVATGRHRKVHWDAAKRVLHYLCSTSGIRLVLGGRGPVVLTDHADASSVEDSATQRSSQGYIFSLGSGSVSWRSTRSSSVLSSSCEAEIYAGAMAAQELRWLTYLLTDLGEQPRSPPVLYVDNKAMNALCQKHRLEHRTKHIALRYFLARELQQRGQLRLAYVATRANTADVFTKALPPGDHQCFVTVLDLVPTLPHLLTT
ncbi:unnamed protein product [Closterium sp. NIES-54]